MNIVRVLIEVFKVLLHESIDKNGINSVETVKLSQTLDTLILNLQIKEYNRHRVYNKQIS